MRHRVAHRKLGRTSSHRRALLRNLCTSLIVHERIITTLQKAKELRPFAEKAITLGRRGSHANTEPAAAVHARRTAADYFIGGHAERKQRAFRKASLQIEPATGGVQALDKLFDEIGPRFADRNGGYTRIIKLGYRKGDGAEIALIELIGSEVAPTTVKEEKSAAKGDKKAKGKDKGEEKVDKKAKGKGAKETTKEEEKPAKKTRAKATAKNEEEPRSEEKPAAKRRKKKETEES
ncbi:MAG TPA: 50S ribosomal protein L17 [Blastocatellia bacterium]|nr:50S ribosomal protein L17 [Blastocatellia bacterium]